MQMDGGDEPDVHVVPIDHNWRLKACSIFGIVESLLPIDETMYSALEAYDISRYSEPSEIRDVQSDGNCLFRTFSHVFTGGDEERHAEVREKVSHSKHFIVANDC